MRWVVDRRAQPSENNGTLTIAGERGEVLKAAVEHAVPSRGHTDSEELRSAIESARARADRRRVSAGPQPLRRPARSRWVDSAGMLHIGQLRCTRTSGTRAIESCCAPP